MATQFTRINPTQLQSLGGFSNLSEELRALSLANMGATMDADISYEYDHDGNLIKETILDTEVSPNILQETVYSYTISGELETETVTLNGVVTTKTYSRDVNNRIASVSIRKSTP